MTEVYYECFDIGGSKIIVHTLAEAQQIQKEGGSYEVKYKENVSRCTEYAKRYTRKAGRT